MVNQLIGHQVFKILNQNPYHLGFFAGNTIAIECEWVTIDSYGFELRQSYEFNLINKNGLV